MAWNAPSFSHPTSKHNSTLPARALLRRDFPSKNPMSTPKRIPPSIAETTAFTLIELLIVIAVIAILAAMLLPVLAGGKKRAETAVCINNLKQLQIGWAGFIDDNAGELPSNTAEASVLGIGRGKNWVLGVMGYENAPATFADSTDAQRLINPKLSQIGPYIRSPAMFKCPSDRSYFLQSGVRYPRVRSYSMNGWLGNHVAASRPAGAPTPIVPAMMTRASITSEDIFVFIEEHEDSINDGQFVSGAGYTGRSNPAQYSWSSFPAARHANSATVSFVDGHVELHRWMDPRTSYPVTRSTIPYSAVTAPNSPDIEWIDRHTARIVP